MKRVIVPIDLGGSPRVCALSPPRDRTPEADLVEGLIGHYRRERLPPDGRLEVAFFRGGIPDPSLLEAAAGLPMRVACHPADLDPATARALVEAGVETIELDAITFDLDVLRATGRGYRPSTLHQMLAGLGALGLRVGITLWPGLPGSSHATAIEDVRQLVTAPRPPDLVRLIPAVAFRGTELARLAQTGRWTPMNLGQAVTTLVEMIGALEAGGIPVARVGIQPGQDLPHPIAAGPYHPNLRGLCEVRRFRSRMATALEGIAPGTHVTLAVHPSDLSWAKGTANENLRSLRAEKRLANLTVQPDHAVLRGMVRLTQNS